MPDETDSNTVYGVVFGPLKPALREHSYPVTRTELIEQYGGFELQHADGSDRLTTVLQEVDVATFREPRQVRDAILDALEPTAVGDRSSRDGTDRAGNGGRDHDDMNGTERAGRNSDSGNGDSGNGDSGTDGGGTDDGSGGPGDWSPTSV